MERRGAKVGLEVEVYMALVALEGAWLAAAIVLEPFICRFGKSGVSGLFSCIGQGLGQEPLVALFPSIYGIFGYQYPALLAAYRGVYIAGNATVCPGSLLVIFPSSLFGVAAAVISSS